METFEEILTTQLIDTLADLDLLKGDVSEEAFAALVETVTYQLALHGRS